MNAKMMDHEHAMKNLIAERYLLGELTESERDAYEEHLFSCSACFEQVSLGTEFIGHLKESGSVETALAVSARPGFMASLLAGFRQPAPALVFGLLLCVSGFSVYQNSIISKQKGPRLESRYVLTGIAHGAGDSQLLQVTRNTGLSLSVEYTPKGEFVAYNARILSESGKVIDTLVVPGNQFGSTATVGLTAGDLAQGKYAIVILGRNSDGVEKEVGHGAFELQFTDK